MDINTLKPFDRVIVNDNSYFNGRICIVDWIFKGMVGLSNCINPQEQYVVGIWNANNISKLS